VRIQRLAGSTALVNLCRPCWDAGYAPAWVVAVTRQGGRTVDRVEPHLGYGETSIHCDGCGCTLGSGDDSAAVTPEDFDRHMEAHPGWTEVPGGGAGVDPQGGTR
jgi:hypothetical protein